jgi:hypothetical protein
MAKPKSKAEAIQDDEAQYVSPTSDDTAAERYQKVRNQEATMTNEERLKRLREAPSIFDFEADKIEKEGEA